MTFLSRLSFAEMFLQDYAFTKTSCLLCEMAVRLIEKEKVNAYTLFLFSDVLVFATKKKDGMEGLLSLSLLLSAFKYLSSHHFSASHISLSLYSSFLSLPPSS